MGITGKMARFALSLRYEDIPETARHEARRFLLDSLGCALAAVSNDDMAAALRYIQKLGGVPEATAIGTGHRTNAPNAALMNALLIRAMDYNDIYWKQDPGHPSDVIPAVLSTGEKAGRSTREALVGIILCYELMVRWCRAATPGIREKGWHHASLTQFVSPLAAARMLGLNESQAVAAVGISASCHFTLGGVVAGHLTHMKNTADPLATEAGVRAALLSAENYTGPVEIIEGKEGLFDVLNQVQWSADVISSDLGERFLITECGYKAFPSEALTHQPITAVLNAMQKNGLSGENIDSIIVRTTTRGTDILSDPSKFKPTTKETADHSLPYCIAAAAVDGDVVPASFDKKRLADPKITRMLARIEVVADPDIDALFPRVKRAIVTIMTTDGRHITEQVDHAKGCAENPMSDEEVIAKFRSNTNRSLPASRQEEIIETTMVLGKKEESIGRFMSRLILDEVANSRSE